METQHIDHGGAAHFTLGVEIETADSSEHHAARRAE
jgi:hypothetical protein